MSAPVAENYQLKWHSFTSHLHSCVASSINSESFADVSLFTVDGHRVQAHRFILSACSQYLHQVLKAHQKTNTALPIIIVLPPEIDFKTLRTLIQYMYSGETTVSKDILASVLRGGDILKVKGLWRPKEDEPSAKPEQPTKNPAKPRHFAKKTQNNAAPEPPNRAEAASEEDAAEKPATPDETSKTSPEEAPFMAIKEEPLEWSEVVEGDMELLDENSGFHTEMTIKPEVLMEPETTEEAPMYSPLTCELCTETFLIPADWVKHIQTHTDMLPAKRQRRGRTTDEDDGTFPPLQCDLCQKYFPTPAEWVHHVQDAHTEQELRQSNRRGASPPVRSAKLTKTFPGASSLKTCSLCNKKFPSHASMLIHKRTHTGERPYSCEYCSKGFNVKSNLLRHLRTLHDKIVNPYEVDCGIKEEEIEVKDEEVH